MDNRSCPPRAFDFVLLFMLLISQVLHMSYWKSTNGGNRLGFLFLRGVSCYRQQLSIYAYPSMAMVWGPSTFFTSRLGTITDSTPASYLHFTSSAFTSPT